jgi:hypothetical protein
LQRAKLGLGVPRGGHITTPGVVGGGDVFQKVTLNAIPLFSVKNEIKLDCFSRVNLTKIKVERVTKLRKQQCPSVFPSDL